MIMAITMIFSAASCGSADNGGAATKNADNGGAAAVKTDDAVKTEAKRDADDGGKADAMAAAPATTAAAAAAEEAAEPAVMGDTAEYAMEADMMTADGGGMALSAKKKSAEGAAFDAEAPAAAGDTAAVRGDDKDAHDEILPDDMPEPEPEPKLPEAGQLTAGEWNDNDNWGFFSNLVSAGTIKFPSFSLDPTTRCAVSVKTSDGKPAVNAKVRLLDEDGKVIWSAVSDKKGMAYLFTTGSAVPATIEAELDGDKQTADYKAPETDGQGNKKASNASTEITLEGSSKLYTDTEVMFIVDTTGSMSDEMLFLQSEFSAITREIGTDNVKYAVSFYRDKGDDYVTKHNDFTGSVDELQRALNNETADGGGDYPEAVAQVLTETITKGKWSDESVKLAFLIFDAPPHEGTEKELLAAAKAAGEKGIRIVPVVSSDSDRDTELFARSLAIMSGGTYVFLTDDSGIGGGHLEPIIGDYKVEKLYDIIIRVITEYRQ